MLGEFTLTNIMVEARKTLRLPALTWQPLRYGKQLWDIGIPNRTAAEFFKGDEYFHWGWYLEYPKLFPNDVHYVIGKSDFRKDWFFEQVPHNEDPGDTTGHEPRAEHTWRSRSTSRETRTGRQRCAWRSAALGRAASPSAVNDHSVGAVTGLIYNATINRDGIGGYWSEHDLAFDAVDNESGPKRDEADHSSPEA